MEGDCGAEMPESGRGWERDISEMMGTKWEEQGGGNYTKRGRGRKDGVMSRVGSRSDSMTSRVGSKCNVVNEGGGGKMWEKREELGARNGKRGRRRESREDWLMCAGSGWKI